METISAYLHSRDIRDADLILDGTIKAIKTDKFNGWYIGDDLGNGKRRITIEDWRTKDRQTLSEGFQNTPEEEAALEASRARYEEEKLRLQLSQKNDSARDIKKFFEMSLEWTGVSEYLKRKKIAQSFGALQIQSNIVGTEIIVPLCDSLEKVWNYQSIQEDGFKTFQPGARVDGLWFKLISESEKQNPDIILICEGFATSCSVQMAVPYAQVVCAFSAGNLREVAENMRAMNKYAKIIICGDDDWKLDENAGRIAAESAALVSFGSTVFPVFAKTRGRSWTDFNDLHCGYHLIDVTLQIETAIGEAKVPSSDWIETTTQATTLETSTFKSAQKAADQLFRAADSGAAITPYINGVSPMPMRTNKQGTPILPNEFDVAASLMKYYQDRAIISENCVFLYENNHWTEVDEDGERKIKVQIQVLCNGLAGHNKLHAIFEQWKNILPKAPRNLFVQDPSIINLQNGTVHVEKVKEVWRFRFAAHNKENYCTNIIPIDYDETRKIRNAPFEAMIGRICGEDENSEKFKAVRQMYGAAVSPIFPHLFMLYGPAASGKTSLIIPAMRLVHKDNWSSVEPHEFEKQFGMESMAGKLVNIVTDIDITKNIADNHIKKIEDRIPVRIDRKFKNAVKAPLPTVHIFGGNDIPPTYEKGSGAHERRWTFLHIEGLKITGNYSKSFANDVFDANPIGVLNFALDGLVEVLEANGHYFVPESGKAKMKRWQMEHDPVAQFIHEIGEGGEGKLIGWKLDPEGKVLRSAVWAAFGEWYDEAYNKKPRIGKTRFYEAISKCKSESAKFEIKIVDGLRYFSGLRVGENVEVTGRH